MKNDMYHVYCHNTFFPTSYRRKVKYQLKDRTGLVYGELTDPGEAARICVLLNDLHAENERLRNELRQIT